MTTQNCRFKPLSEEERRLIAEEGLNLDIVLQLLTLREQHGLSQAELAAKIGTKQQAVSRMESPGYDRHSLATLRRVAEALDAFVDVILVPQDKLEKYMEWRYEPLLMDKAPGEEHTSTIQWRFFTADRTTDTFEAHVSRHFVVSRKETVVYSGEDESVVILGGEAVA